MIWILKLFLSSSFAMLTRKMGMFVTLPRSDVQKGAMAFMKESKKSRTNILLLSEISWGTVLKTLRLVYYISYRNVQARDHFISVTSCRTFSGSDPA